MSYEKPLKGNPNKLTINQHVFPAASIARYAKEDGLVEVYFHENKKRIRLRPDNPLFCAQRVWNQTAEHGYMKRVEDAFQALAKVILSGASIVDHNEHITISKFHSLCRLRAEARENPLPDVEMKGILPGRVAPTKDQEENLEKNGYSFARGSTIPSRHMVSVRIQILLSRLFPMETTWAIAYSRNIEFIAPDSFFEIGIVPLSPNCCLVANAEHGEMSAENALQINRIAIEKSKKYMALY